ncbi:MULTISPECIES: hypothetical protein [Mycobacterium]|uniref:PE domain-containing protein n=1 Tax=Mycobacterium kyorinense TaxID=487514 RepID=A0A1X1YMH0_9MYCO|nr:MULTISPECIES: hypothetical protein [Mycobacterium]ORW12223.1 hypothetical protein AWC14_01150 [Mycobacterium kyorinense]
MADIRGNTTGGAAAGSSVGMHLHPEFPPVPTGSDPKSQQIAAELKAFIEAAHREIAVYNQSVDALRAGMTAAPQATETTDQSGADTVNSSGEGRYTI